jgi:hypothetical protein
VIPLDRGYTQIGYFRVACDASSKKIAAQAAIFLRNKKVQRIGGAATKGGAAEIFLGTKEKSGLGLCAQAA